MSSSRDWFLTSIRRQVDEVMDNVGIQSIAKAGILGYYMGQLDGAGVIVDGDPAFFRACCDLRNDIKRMRDELK